MTRTLIIPDIHLKTSVLDSAEIILNSNLADNVVMIGDYFDEFGARFRDDLFLNTIERLKDFSSKRPTTMLLGNHDAMYLSDYNSHVAAAASRDVQHKIQQFIIEEDLYLSCKVGKYLISHAGFTQDYNYLVNKRVSDLSEDDIDYLDEDDSPIWLRALDDVILNKEYPHQIVGHTPVKSIASFRFFSNDYDFSTTYVDTMSLDPATMTRYGTNSMIVIDDSNDSLTKITLDRGLLVLGDI